MLGDNVTQKRMSSFLDQKLKGYDFLILENKNYGWVSFVSAMLIHCTVEQEEFLPNQNLAVSQDENKSDLEHVK